MPSAIFILVSYDTYFPVRCIAWIKDKKYKVWKGCNCLLKTEILSSWKIKLVFLASSTSKVLFL